MTVSVTVWITGAGQLFGEPGDCGWGVVAGMAGTLPAGTEGPGMAGTLPEGVEGALPAGVGHDLSPQPYIVPTMGSVVNYRVNRK